MDIAQLGIKIDSQSAVKAEGDLERLTVAAGKADAAADRLAANTGKVAPAMAGAGQGSRMLALQLSQVAQQTSATGNFVQALAIQLPDMAIGFGAVGIAASIVASVALPALVSALSSGESEAKSFEEALDTLQSRLSDLQDTAKVFSSDGLAEMKEKYGELNAEILQHIELMRQVDMREAMIASKDAIASLSAELEGFFTDQYNGLRDLFGLGLIEANKLYASFERAKAAGSFDDQVEALTQIRNQIMDATGGIQNMTDEQFAFYTQVQDSLDSMLQLSQAAAQTGWLSGMISEAQSLAGSLWDAVSAKWALADDQQYSAMGDDERGSQRGQRASGGEFRSQQAVRERRSAMGRGGGGGGGGGVDQYAADLEALVGSLESEREILDAWYEESQMILADRRAQEILGTQAHQETLLALEAEYQQRLLEIDEQAGNSRLALAEGIFGGLADFASAAGARGEKAARAFGAAEALINVYRAQAQVLGDPKLSFFQKIPAMLAIGAAGMRVVSAIRSGGSAGGGGGAGTIAAQGQQQAQQQTVEYVVRGIDRDALYTGEMFARIFDGLTEEASKRGMQTAVRFV